VRDDRDVAQLCDLMHVANVAAPFVPLHDHSPGAGLEVAALDRLTDVCAALRRGYTPMQTVSAFLEVECRRIPADRNARMVDGGDEVVELCTSKRSGFDDLPPSAHVPGLDPAAAPIVFPLL